MTRGRHTVRVRHGSNAVLTLPVPGASNLEYQDHPLRPQLSYYWVYVNLSAGTFASLSSGTLTSSPEVDQGPYFPCRSLYCYCLGCRLPTHPKSIHLSPLPEVPSPRPVSPIRYRCQASTLPPWSRTLLLSPPSRTSRSVTLDQKQVSCREQRSRHLV